MSEIGHGGKQIVERILDPRTAKEKIKGLKNSPCAGADGQWRSSTSPMDSFPRSRDSSARRTWRACARRCVSTDGTVWSIPIVFDISDKEIADYGVKEGESVVLTYLDSPIAVFDVEEILRLQQTGNGKGRVRDERRKAPRGQAYQSDERQVSRRKDHDGKQADHQRAVHGIPVDASRDEKEDQGEGVGAIGRSSDQKRAPHRT